MSTKRLSTSKTRGQSKSLQALRGFAALILVLYHFTSFVWSKHGVVPFSGLFFFGYSGVNIFFVMSGFLMYYIHHRNFGDYRETLPFIKKRFIRIFPVYWIVLIIAGTGLLVRNKIGLADFISNASLIFVPTRYISPPSWTLWYEVIFYGFIIVVILNKKIGFFSILLWITAIVLNNYSPITKTYYPILDPFNILFPMGMIVAYIGLHLKFKSSEKYYSLAAIAGLILFIVNAGYSVVHSEPDNIVPWYKLSYILGWGVSCSLLMFAAFSKNIDYIFGKCKLLLILGDASYSIFLLHFPLGRMLLRLAQKVGPVWGIKNFIVADLLVLYLSCVVIIICYLFFLYVEKPVLKIMKKHFY